MDSARLLTRGQVTYAEGSPPGGYDPRARLAVMDGEGIDRVLLYPTIGICWEGHVTEPALATAYTRAYNRWLVEFCQVDRRRLYPVAHISLLDADGAVEEAIRARRDGCVGVFLSPDVAARGGRHFDDPAFGRFWETVQDLEMPIAFHVVVRDHQWFRQWLRKDPSDGLFGFAFLAIDVMAAFTQMLSSGMFERYPRLRCAVLEAGSNWIAAWLDRLDDKHRVMAHQTPIRMPPSAYFYRQCMISADPDESVTAQMIEHLGADYFIWASDYPHIDASFGVVEELRSDWLRSPPRPAGRCWARMRSASTSSRRDRRRAVVSARRTTAPLRRSGRLERHRQPLDASDEVRAQLLRLGRGLDVR